MKSKKLLNLIVNEGHIIPVDDLLEMGNQIEKDLEVLEIFKKYLYIRISEKPNFDDLYLVALQEDREQECDYTCIFVNKKEKELLKEWLDNVEYKYI